MRIVLLQFMSVTEKLGEACEEGRSKDGEQVGLPGPVHGGEHVGEQVDGQGGAGGVDQGAGRETSDDF